MIAQSPESLILLFLDSIKLIAIISIVAVISFKLIITQPLQNVVDFLLHWFAICLTVVLTIQLVLLWIGFLGYWGFLLASTFFLGLIIVKTGGKIPDPKLSLSIFNSAQKLFYTPLQKLNLSFVLLVTASISYLLGTAYENMFLPPTSADALAYHLPMAAQWLQQGNILAHDIRVWYYPGNSELILAFLMLPFHADYVVKFADIIYLSIVALATTRLITFHKKSASTALLGGILLVTTPLFVRTLGALGNDLFLVMVFVLGLYFIFYAATTKGAKSSLLLSIVCVAILFGTKYTGIAYATVLATCALIMWSRSIWNIDFKYMPFVVGSIVLLGGTYYFRNLVLTGNPVYPTGINFGPLNFPTGDLSHLVASTQGISEEELKYSSLLTSGQLNVVIPSLGYHAFHLSWVLLALCVIMIGTSLKKKYSLNESCYGKLTILIVLLCASIIFLITPMSAENIPGTLNQIHSGASLRFGLPAFAMLAIFSIISIESQTKKLNKWLIFLILINVILGISRSFYLFIFTVFVTLVILLIYSLMASGRKILFPFQIDYRNKRIVVTVLIGSIVLFSTLTSVLASVQQTRRLSVYTYGGKTNIIEWLDRQSKESVLLVSIGIRNYPFYGPQLQNRVVALGLSQTLEEWSLFVNQVKPDYIVISREHGDRNSPTFGFFPKQETLFESNPSDFQMVYSDQFVRVYSTISK